MLFFFFGGFSSVNISLKNLLMYFEGRTEKGKEKGGESGKKRVGWGG